MSRKIVQIAARAEGESVYPRILALADDGTVWMSWCSRATMEVSKEWKKLPPIPQESGADR